MPEEVESARKERQPSAVLALAIEPASRSVVLDERIGRLGLSAMQRESVERYSSELLGWGRPSDLRRYLDVLERVVRAEESVGAGSRRLTMAVAANLFKLVAYKDEYEVARLMTDRHGLSVATEAAAAGDRIAWRLHPPILRALGLSRKIAIGAWAAPAIRVLAKAKFLRGTPLDLFGYAEVRRIERRLPVEYLDAIDRVLPKLSIENFEAMVELAELPDLVRGYEEIKLARVETYRAKLDPAIARVSDSGSSSTDAAAEPL